MLKGLAAQVRAKKATFAQLAAMYSDDKEAKKTGGITIVYTKEAETADMYIERASYKLAKNNRVRVVTSDGMEQLIILGNGAIRVTAQEFYEEIKAAEEEIRAIINE